MGEVTELCKSIAGTPRFGSDGRVSREPISRRSPSQTPGSPTTSTFIPVPILKQPPTFVRLELHPRQAVSLGRIVNPFDLRGPASVGKHMESRALVAGTS